MSNKKGKKLISVGFRVNEVHNYIQADALELSTEYLLDPRTIQQVIDPQTNQQKKKILEEPRI